MTLNWQPTVVPTGRIFADILYDFLVPLEAATTDERFHARPVWSSATRSWNVTIGVGFDLRAGGREVQDAVLTALGFNPTIVARRTALVLNGTQGRVVELAEYNYIEQVRQIVANTNSGNVASLQADLNAVMAARAADSSPGYAIVAPDRRAAGSGVGGRGDGDEVASTAR